MHRAMIPLYVFFYIRINKFFLVLSSRFLVYANFLSYIYKRCSLVLAYSIRNTCMYTIYIWCIDVNLLRMRQIHIACSFLTAEMPQNSDSVLNIVWVFGSFFIEVMKTLYSHRRYKLSLFLHFNMKPSIGLILTDFRYFENEDYSKESYIICATGIIGRNGYRVSWSFVKFPSISENNNIFFMCAATDNSHLSIVYNLTKRLL